MESLLIGTLRGEAIQGLGIFYSKIRSEHKIVHDFCGASLSDGASSVGGKRISPKAELRS